MTMRYLDLTTWTILSISGGLLFSYNSAQSNNIIIIAYSCHTCNLLVLQNHVTLCQA